MKLKYRRQLKLQEKAIQVEVVQLKGGTWYLPLDKIADVYKGADDTYNVIGLKNITLKTKMQDVGEIFASDFYYNDKIETVTIPIHLFNN